MQTSILDTHAHLTSPLFARDLNEVLERACSAGVCPIVVVSENLSDADAVLKLCAASKGKALPAVGLHPADVSLLSDAEADEALTGLSSILRQNLGSVVAVGEIGLDHTPRVLSSGSGDVPGRQERIFRGCLALAREHSLPVTVHSRGAGRHAVSILADMGMSQRAVLHAFDGRAVYAEQAVANGCALSIPPCVVRSTQMQKMVKRVPLDNLLIETDSPVLGVDASGRNEPVFAVKAVEMVAAIKCVSINDCRRYLDRNARARFPKAFRTQ